MVNGTLIQQQRLAQQVGAGGVGAAIREERRRPAPRPVQPQISQEQLERIQEQQEQSTRGRQFIQSEQERLRSRIQSIDKQRDALRGRGLSKDIARLGRERNALNAALQETRRLSGLSDRFVITRVGASKAIQLAQRGKAARETAEAFERKLGTQVREFQAGRIEAGGLSPILQRQLTRAEQVAVPEPSGAAAFAAAVTAPSGFEGSALERELRAREVISDPSDFAQTIRARQEEARQDLVVVGTPRAEARPSALQFPEQLTQLGIEPPKDVGELRPIQVGPIAAFGSQIVAPVIGGAIDIFREEPLTFKESFALAGRDPLRGGPELIKTGIFAPFKTVQQIFAGGEQIFTEGVETFDEQPILGGVKIVVGGVGVIASAFTPTTPEEVAFIGLGIKGFKVAGTLGQTLIGGSLSGLSIVSGLEAPTLTGKVAGIGGGVILGASTFGGLPRTRITEKPLRRPKTPQFEEISIPIVTPEGKVVRVGKFTILSETAPPIQVFEQSGFRDLLGLDPKLVRVKPPKITVIETPFLVEGKDPFFATQRKVGGQVVDVTKITGESLELNIKTLKGLDLTEQFALKGLVSEELGITGVGGKGFKVGIDLKSLPKSLTEGAEFSRAFIEAEKQFKFSRRDLDTLTIPPPGRRISKSQAISRARQVAEVENFFTIFQVRTSFKDVTKPFARARGKTPQLIGTLLSFERPLFIRGKEFVFRELKPSDLAGETLASFRQQQQALKQVSLLPKPIVPQVKTPSIKITDVGGLSISPSTAAIGISGISVKGISATQKELSLPTQKDLSIGLDVSTRAISLPRLDTIFKGETILRTRAIPKVKVKAREKLKTKEKFKVKEVLKEKEKTKLKQKEKLKLKQKEKLKEKEKLRPFPGLFSPFKPLRPARIIILDDEGKKKPPVKKKKKRKLRVPTEPSFAAIVTREFGTFPKVTEQFGVSPFQTRVIPTEFRAGIRAAERQSARLLLPATRTRRRKKKR